MSSDLTLEQFQAVLPKNMKKTVNPALVASINKIISDPMVREVYRDNLLGYANILSEGKFKLSSYIDAVRYVGYKVMGNSNQEAYIKTFPDRYQTFITNNTTAKDIASYVSSYNKNKLVNLIFEQTLVPTHILNADLFQQALNTQADLMHNANSEKVRSDAANSILTHLKRPETQKIELDITEKEDSSIKELRATTLELVEQQRKSLSAGIMSAKEVAHSKIIEGSCEQVQ